MNNHGKTKKILQIPADIWNEYQKGIDYNCSVDLYNRVKLNEHFYSGNQWEGLNAPDLEKPVLNFLKRAISYCIAMLVSDDIAVNINSFRRNARTDILDAVLGAEVERVIEIASLKALNRDCLRNAAVDGDCCIYLRFDPDATSARGKNGEITAEIIENTNIIFANPYLYDLQRQSYIIIVKRVRIEDIRERARRMGVADWELIIADDAIEQEDAYGNNGMVTVLLKLWRDTESGTVHFAESTRNVLLAADIDTGYKRYPLAYMSWEQMKSSYHGQPALSAGLIENQIYVNTLWSLFMIHQKKMAFPKMFYDVTKIDHWTNKVGQAVGVIGNPNEAVVSSFRTPDFSVQAMELVEKTIAYSKEFIGATDAALGNVRPDNASAIIAVQQAAAAPLEIQRQGYYKFTEDIVRCIVDIIRCDYGIREVSFTGGRGGGVLGIDFSAIGYDSLDINVDIGASSYWSELMQVRTADNLFTKGVITDAIMYLESIPDKHIKNKQGMIEKLKEMRAAEDNEKTVTGNGMTVQPKLTAKQAVQQLLVR